MKASFETETFVPDCLIAGNSHLLAARKVMLAAGQKLPRGAVLGLVVATGLHVLSVAAAEDGSEIPDVILAEAADASSGNVEALAYSRGDFVASALTLGEGHTQDSITEALRNKGIGLFDALA